MKRDYKSWVKQPSVVWFEPGLAQKSTARPGFLSIHGQPLKILGTVINDCVLLSVEASHEGK